MQHGGLVSQATLSTCPPKPLHHVEHGDAPKQDLCTTTHATFQHQIHNTQISVKQIYLSSLLAFTSTAKPSVPRQKNKNDSLHGQAAWTTAMCCAKRLTRWTPSRTGQALEASEVTCVPPVSGPESLEAVVFESLFGTSNQQRLKNPRSTIPVGVPVG